MDLAARLARLTASPLILGALLLDREGTLLAATPGTDARLARCVVLAALVGVADRVFDSGAVRYLIAQDHENRLVVGPVEHGLFLAAIARGASEVGSALPLVSRAAEGLAGRGRSAL
jgi:predicted regulator of Ras-like GTPase activity (Roadblock/LC7/MglB family)